MIAVPLIAAACFLVGYMTHRTFSDKAGTRKRGRSAQRRQNYERIRRKYFGDRG